MDEYNYEEYEYIEDEPRELYLPELDGKFLAIVTPDRRLILDSHPSLTFQRFIEYIGEETIFNLDITVENGLPLVTKEWPEDRTYEATANGWFACTHIGMKKKIAAVKEIGDRLGFDFRCATKRVH